MIRSGLAALLSHWRRRPGQFATLIAGLALATALWSGVQAINAQARASYANAAAEVSAAAMPRIDRIAGALSFADYAHLRRAGWLVSPVIEGATVFGGTRIRMLGIDPLTAPAGLAVGLAPGKATPAIEGSAALFAEPGTAQRLGIGVTPLPGLQPGLVVTDIRNASALLGKEGPTRLILLPDQPLRQTPLAEIDPDMRVTRPEGTGDLARLTDSFHLNLTAFGLLSFAVGLFVVHGAIGLAFEERRPMLRTLRALGLPLRVLGGLLATELFILALIGGGIGVVLGYLVAAALLPDVAATLQGLYGASVSGTLTLNPVWWLSGLAMSLAGTGLAGAGALWRLARMPLLAPARPRAWAMASGRSERIGALAALALLISAAAILWRGNGLAAGFAGLGSLLLGAALALPYLLGLGLRLGQSMARGPVACWLWADTRQQLPGLSLALMALMLALATNVGVGTMVASFRLTFTGWLDQRLASELYITARTPAEAAELAVWLAPQVDAILPIWHVDRRVAGAPAQIYGVADHATYRQNWPVLDGLPDLWDRVAQGQGAMINEQLARREGLAPGDPLALPGWDTIVAGVYSDYGNPIGQVLISTDQLTARFPEVEKLRFGIRIAPDQVGVLTDAIAARGLPRGNMIDQARLKAESLAVFEQTFVVTGALNVLTLAVAGFAMLTSLLTLAALRLPQLAPVWALGMERGRLARIELARTVGLAAATFVLALPVGLALAWVLLAVINVEAFGWRLPMHVFPADWLWLLALALLAAGLAALAPALRLMRRPPADLLRVFASER